MAGGDQAGEVETREAAVRWEAGGFGEAGGAIFAGHPSGGALLADGRVAVADPGQAAILLFEPNGELAVTFGRRGYGPGEFQRLGHVGVLADTALWATDSQSTWVTLFDIENPDSSWTISMPDRQVPGTNWSVTSGWLLSDGRVLGRAQPSATGRRLGETPSEPLVAMTPEGGVEVIESMPNHSPRKRNVAMPNGFAMQTDQPLSANPLFGAAPSGDWLYVLDRSPPSGPEGVMAFRRYTSSGDLLSEAEMPYEATPVGDEVLGFIRGWANAFEEQTPPQMGITAEAVLDSTWIPEWLPPAHDALVDENGLWIHRQPWLDGWWQRFSLDGQLLFEVQLPSAVTVLAGSDTSLLGWNADSLDVPVIRLFEISEGSR